MASESTESAADFLVSLGLSLEQVTYSCPTPFGPDLDDGQPRYVLEELIGLGRSEVYRARDRKLSTPDRPFIVAMKLRRDDVLSEASKAGVVRHRSVAQVFDAGVQDGRAYVIQEIISGEPFGHEEQTTRQLIEGAAEIGEALQAYHKVGVVHNDVKPANIMVGVDGLCRLVDPETVAGIDEKPGGYTRAFAAPELLEDSGTGTPATDVYALAATLAQVLDERDPPSDVLRVCERAMAHDPRERHDSIAEFSADLRRALIYEPLPWARYSPSTRVWRWMRRHPIRLGVGVAALITLTSAMIAFKVDYDRQQLALVTAEQARTMADKQVRDMEARMRIVFVDRAKAVMSNDEPADMIRHLVFLEWTGIQSLLGKDGAMLMRDLKMRALREISEDYPPEWLDGVIIRYSLAYLLVTRDRLSEARGVLEQIDLAAMGESDPTRIGAEALRAVCDEEEQAAARSLRLLREATPTDPVVELVEEWLAQRDE